MYHIKLGQFQIVKCATHARRDYGCRRAFYLNANPAPAADDRDRQARLAAHAPWAAAKAIDRMRHRR